MYQNSDEDLRKRPRSAFFVDRISSITPGEDRISSMSLPLMNFTQEDRGAVAIHQFRKEDSCSHLRNEDPAVSSLSSMAYTRIFIALMIGTAIEWFDFSIYSGFGSLISALFFPVSNPGLQVRDGTHHNLNNINFAYAMAMCLV